MYNIHLYIKLYNSVYIDILFFITLSIQIYHTIFNTVPYALQQDLVVYLFYIQQFASANSKLPVLSSPTHLPLGNKSVPSVCKSVSVLQIGSFALYLDCTFNWYHKVSAFLSLTYSLSVIISRSIRVAANSISLIFFMAE